MIFLLLHIIGLHNENKRNQFQEKLNCVRKAWALVKERLKDHGNFSNLNKFLFWTMDYSSWGSKNRIGSKFYASIEVDVKCMQINFDGHGLLCFGDIATFQIWPNLHFDSP